MKIRDALFWALVIGAFAFIAGENWGANRNWINGYKAGHTNGWNQATRIQDLGKKTQELP